MNTRVEEQKGNLQNHDGGTVEALQLSCKGMGHWENYQGKGRGGILATLLLTSVRSRWMVLKSCEFALVRGLNSSV